MNYLPLTGVVLATALSGCGSSTTQTSSAVDLNALDAKLSSEIGAPITEYTRDAIGYADVPTGNASFTGLVVGPTNNEQQVVVGEMTVEMDFGSETLTGGANKFGVFSVSGDATTPSDFTEVEALDGTLTISNGTTSEGASINIAGDLDGTLTGTQLGTYEVDGSFTGSVGQSTTSTALIANGEIDGSVFINGSPVTAGDPGVFILVAPQP